MATTAPATYGPVNPKTGGTDRYIKTLTRVDGKAVSVANADGVLYKAYQGAVYERENPERVSLTDLGLIADDETPLQLQLEAWKAKLPVGSTLVVPRRPKPYYFEALPAKYNNLGGTPVCINIGTDTTHFEFERGGAGFRFAPKAVGIQITGGLTQDTIQLLNPVLQGPPRNAVADGRVDYNGALLQDGTRNPDAGRPIGSPSQRYENYKYNVVNMWGKTRMVLPRISGGTGFGVGVYGHYGVFAPGIAFELPGKLGDNRVNGGVNFYPDDVTAAAIPPGWVVVLGGVATESVGFGPTFAACRYVDGLPYSGRVLATVIPHGGALIADNSAIEGGEIVDSGGAAVALAGPDSNLLNITDTTIRNPGWTGIFDGSFLGINPFKVHFTACGANFNVYPGDPEGREVAYPVGPFITKEDTAFTDWTSCYTEMDQGPGYLGQSATSRGAIQGAGLIGPGFWQQGAQVSHLGCGTLAIRQNEVVFNEDIHLGTHNGRTAFYTGRPDAGQHIETQLAFAKAGDYLPAPGTTDATRLIAEPGPQFGAYYTGTTGHFEADMPLDKWLATRPAGMQLRAGDTYRETRGRSWACTSPGVLGLPELEGTVKPNGPTLRFSDVPNARPGDFVTVGGVVYELLRQTTDGPSDWYVWPQPVFDGSLPVQYASPAWA